MHHFGHLDRHALGVLIAIGVGVFVALCGAFVSGQKWPED